MKLVTDRVKNDNYDLVLDKSGQSLNGVQIVLYPLSTFRAMNKAALTVYETLRTQGTQKGVTDLMQTRSELYEVLDYHAYEDKLDQLFTRRRPTS